MYFDLSDIIQLFDASASNMILLHIYPI